MTFNGRLSKLEVTFAPSAGLGTCRTCHLRHVRPLTLQLVRGALRVKGGSGVPLAPRVPLCLCDCCGDTGDRWLTRLSHGLPVDEDAA